MLTLLRANADVNTARLHVAAAAGRELDANSVPDDSLLTQVTEAGQPAPSAVTAALEGQRDAAVANAHAQRRTQAPVLKASADAGARGQLDRIFPVYRIALTLEIPLLDGGVSSASEHLAIARAEELAAMARDGKAQTQLGDELARAQLSNANESIRLAEELLEVATNAQRHALDQRELGGPIEPVLQAHARMAAAKLELLGARGVRASAVLRLKRAGVVALSH
jgi:outer membrane protein TolC